MPAPEPPGFTPRTPARPPAERAPGASAARAALERAVDDLLALPARADDAGALLARTGATLDALLLRLVEAEQAGMGRAVLHALLPRARRVVACAPFFAHAQTWPMGIVGDHRIVEALAIGGNPLPAGTLAHALQAWALASPLARQLRHRLRWQAALLAETFARRPAARVLSLGCGAALDVCAGLGLLPPGPEATGAARGAVVLNDASAEALAAARRTLQRALARGDGPGVSLVAGHAVRHPELVAPLGPFDLVLLGDLPSYLSDRVALALATRVFAELLAPGGRLACANVARGQPFRACLDYLVTWPLVERDDAALLALVDTAARDAGRVAPLCTVQADPSGLSLTLLADAAA